MGHPSFGLSGRPAIKYRERPTLNAAKTAAFRMGHPLGAGKVNRNDVWASRRIVRARDRVRMNDGAGGTAYKEDARRSARTPDALRGRSLLCGEVQE